jgi:hypothetical protein
MTLKTFAKLHAEFLETDKRFKDARTIKEQDAILDKMERIVREMEVVIENAEPA